MSEETKIVEEKEPEAEKISEAKSEQLVSALRSTHSTGVTGPLSFDETGDLPVAIELGVFHDGKAVRELAR